MLGTAVAGPYLAPPNVLGQIGDKFNSLIRGGSIHQAVAANDTAAVVALLQRRPGIVNERNADRLMPLHFATTRPMVELLASFGANLNATRRPQNNYDDTALHHAAYVGNLEVAAAMVRLGAKLEMRAMQQDTPMHYAAQTNQASIAALLAGAGANINVRNEFGETPVMRAVHYAACDALVWFLQRRAQIDLDAALNEALSSGMGRDDRVVELLLAEGANPNKPGFRGQTPLHRAASMLMARSCALLINKGAAVNARDDEGNTPLKIVRKGGLFIQAHPAEMASTTQVLVSAGGTE